MKILHLTPQIEPELGGIATLMSQIVRAFAARGHQQSIITSHGLLDLPESSSERDIAVHRLPFYTALETRNAALLLRCKVRATAIKRDFAPDLVHVCIGGPVAFLHMATAREAAAPLIVTVCDLPAHLAQSPTLVQLLESATVIVAISRVRLDDLCRELPSIAGRCRLIYPTIERPTAHTAGDDQRESTPLILTGGRFVPEKGLAAAIDAFALVHASRPDARLVITGDGQQRQALNDQCRFLGLEQSISFTGRLSPAALEALRERAWVTVVPTLTTESFGLVALEAMIAGSPVVASELEGLKEIVVDGNTGRLVPPGDSTAIAAAVLEIITDSAARQRMSAASRRHAVAHFSWESFVDDYGQLAEDAVT